MRSYHHQNHYELLEISPSAGLNEITDAYHRAIETFNPDSVATYTLFNERERTDLLDRLKAAYNTLSNSRSRLEYDRTLMAAGELPSGAVLHPDKGPPDKPLDGGVRPRYVMGDHRPLEPLTRGQGEPLNLEAGQVLTGEELKRLRDSRGVSLEDMARRTRIGREYLARIEADDHDRLPAMVYLKGFLKAYGRALELDPDLVCQSYLAGMEG